MLTFFARLGLALPCLTGASAAMAATGNSVTAISMVAETLGFGLATAFVIIYIAFFFYLLRSKTGRQRVLRAFSAFNQGLRRAVQSFIGVDVEFSADPRNVRRLRAEMRRLRGAGSSRLSRATEEQIVELFRSALKRDFGGRIEEALRELTRQAAADVTQNEILDRLTFVANQLQKASSTVTIRGIVNLIIGIVFAFGALYILREAVALFDAQTFREMTTAEMSYLIAIRISLALAIILISYFFLSLYRRSLEDVRYYQNEITSVMATAAGVSMALTVGSDEVRAYVIARLIEAERNSLDRPPPAEHAQLSEKLLSQILEKLPSVKIS